MISTTSTRIAYTGDASTTAFPVPFPFFAASDLEVTERVIATGAETVKALGTDYTVAGGDGTTGTVTAAAAPAATVQWIIRRTTARTQLVDFVSNDPLPAEQLEAAQDRAAMRDQEIDDAVARSLRFPASDDAALSALLPNSVDRQNKFLFFDGTGAPTVSPGVTTTAITLPVSVANGGTGATSAAAARAALAAAGLADNNVLTGTLRLQGASSMESSDAGAGEGPTFNLDRLSASPAASDLIGALALRGKDSGGNTETYAKILAQIIDPANGSEDANLLFQTMVAGALATRGYFGSGLVLGAPTGGDPGAGIVNAQGYKINNVDVVIQKYAKCSYAVASGTNGGNTVATTWTTLPINIKDNDANGIAALASNQITPAAGTYRCVGRCVFANANVRAKLRLRNVTGGATLLVGDTVGGGPNGFSVEAFVSGEFTVAAGQALELQYYSAAATTDGLGSALTSGELEVYRAIEFVKVA
jgi:hypothetical protein